MYNQTVKEGKTIAIISYITVIGLIIAFVMNQKKHNYFATFHIRQALGISLLNFAISILYRYANIGFTGELLGYAAFGLSIYGIVGAIQGKENKIPLFGDYFQDWFKNIS